MPDDMRWENERYPVVPCIQLSHGLPQLVRSNGRQDKESHTGADSDPPQQSMDVSIEGALPR